VKSNIGHLEAAAGAAGLIKTVLALHACRLPPSLHFQSPSPHIAFAELGLAVQAQVETWPERAHPPTAGVSSFGFGGTNCHMLLRAEPAPTAHDDAGPVFVFAGNGGVWPGMGRDLLTHSPTFAALIDQLDGELARMDCDWRLRSLLGDGPLAARIEEPALAQPALYAWQLGVTELLREQGVVPVAVTGHSVGEVAAAVAAGAFDAAQGLRIVVERSRLQAETAGQGTMALVMAEPAALASLLPVGVAIAGRNAPRATLLSGSAAALDACLQRLETLDLMALPVRVPVAYHGPQMEPLRPRLVASLQGLAPRPTSVPFVSTVTGGALAGEGLDAAYWGRNLREPVAFHDAIVTLGGMGHRRFVEIAPHTLLATAIGQTVSQAKVLPLTRRGEDEMAAVAALVRTLGARRNATRPRHLLVLSAPTETSLRRLAEQWAQRLPDAFPDLCHTALVGRERFSWRLALHAADGREAQARLLAGDVLIGHVPPDRRPSEFTSNRLPGESWSSFLDRAAEAFVAGDEIDGLVLDAGEPWRVQSAPTYPFERERHWLPSRSRDMIDPGWLLDVTFVPRALAAWPSVTLAATAEDRARTEALDALAVRQAIAALASVEPERIAERHAALARRIASWRETAAVPAVLADGPELRLLQRLDRCLPEILRGEVEPLEVLFPDGNFAEAAELYTAAPLFAGPAKALGRAVRGWAEAIGRPCRILELGAGTGGLTRHLLAALDGVELDYLYTDVSSAFLAWGRERFGNRPGFRTGLIDLEATAIEGVETFDLVIAANALHATLDIRASIAAAAARVAPGGHVALVELVRAPRWIDLAFGTTEGWWRYTDDPVRPDHALLETHVWRQLFEDAGLEPVSVLEDGDAHAVLVARKPTGRRFRIVGDGFVAGRLTEMLPVAEPATDLVIVAAAAAEPVAAVTALEAIDPGPRRWLVRGDGEAAAALGGGFAALGLDRPETMASAIELADESDGSLHALVEELQGDGIEDRVRITAGERRVARLVPRVEPPAEAPPVRADQLYLIAGGLGMLGSAFAGWLVEQGARHLLLVGRRGGVSTAVEGWRRRGAEVRVAALDLAATSAAADLDLLIDRPLAGIVHAAGTVAGDRATVVGGKLAIARTLAAVAARHDLDFMITLSSAAGVWGLRDNPNYAAANAALDAWALAARSKGLPAISLALGRLAERGLLGADEDSALAAAGLEPLPLTAVCRAAVDLAASGTAHLVLARADWRRFVGTIESRRRHPLFDRLRPRLVTAAVPSGEAPPRRVLSGSDLRGLVAEILGHPDPGALDPNRGLFEQGLDSLMALTLRRRLEQATGEPVPTAILFSHPSLARLEEWLQGRTGSRTIAAPTRQSSAIAIVGIGCRFPGGIHGPDAFARALWDGADLIQEVPADRWSNARWYDADPTRPGRIASRWGGFVDGVDLFDAAFFGISPREAAQMDPQQRLLLETAWESLEDAGIAPDRLVGTATAIFVGATGSDYALLARQIGVDMLDGHTLTGQPNNTLAGRLAHFLGTEGPAMVVDTACSSSLVALHLAVRALRAGETSLALAAGVNLLLAPESSVVLSRAGLLAPDGRCKTFDAAANGYVRAEGCGVVVLKPLERAQADGDRIIAVIRGSAVNHDGRSAGFTAPNGLAQEAVIRMALTDAGLDPSAIGMVEAHGTGTALGDPIELDALAEVFKSREAPLLVGSVKTNFGHAEAAAGIAGVIKAALAVGHDTIPPHLHFHTLNPHATAGTARIQVPVDPEPWPVTPARAGISAFGASGTNAHVVLEAPPQVTTTAASVENGVLLVTGATPEAVRELGRRYHAHLAAHDVSFQDACHTTAVGRARLGWWAFARDPAELERLVPSDGPMPDLPVPPGRRVSLPTYPFVGHRHWLECAPTAEALLGPATRVGATGLTIRTGRLDHGSTWLREHVVGNDVILPATGFLSLCVAAGAPTVTGVELLERVEVPPAGRSIQLVRSVDRIELFVEADDAWRCTCTASVAAASQGLTSIPSPPTAAAHISGDQHRDELSRRGFAFGPAFMRIRQLRRSENLAEAELLPIPGSGGLDADPAMLDHALQTLTSLLPEGPMWLPASIEGFAWLGGGEPTHCRARLEQIDGDGACGEAQLLQQDGRTVAAFTGIRLRRVVERHQGWIHELRWQPAQAELVPPGAGWHVIEVGPQDLPHDALGVIDLRPLRATTPEQCLVETAELVRFLAQLLRPPRLLLVSRGAAGVPPLLDREPAPAAVLAGLVPTIAAEHPELRCTWLDLDPTSEGLPAALLSVAPCLALRGGIAYQPELARVVPLPDGPCRLTPGEGATLDDLAAVPMTVEPPGPGEVSVRITASGLNFKDTLVALGRVPGTGLGLEAAGKVVEVGPGTEGLTPGDRVLLFAPGALASHVTLPAFRCVRYPDHLTPAAAATLPIAFLTAWRGLIELAGLRPGQRVLVHAGAGGVGMAAVQLAVWSGAHVFATASPGKQAWARLAGAEATAYSRDTSFAAAVLAWSDGTGVDVVLHALGDDLANASAALLRQGGCFLELGSATKPALPPGVRHLRYDLEQPLAADPDWFRTRMARIFGLLDEGAIRLPWRTELGAEAAGGALTALAQGRTVGRTSLLWPQDELPGPHGTWLVTGGTGAVGGAVARWLVENGAARVVLVARTALTSVPFETVAVDLGDRGAVAAMLAGLPDLTGIVHAAGVVEDSMLANLRPTDVTAVFRAKVGGGRHLHELTRNRQLAAFVVVSSVVGTLGAAGQATYAAANAWLEGLVRARRAEGLPATAIAFGPWQTGMFEALAPAHRARLREQG
ncbi:MAG: SDR family NAD(P)-dependent oxidoreductase, partial [Geminicoccaceae bacterium]